MKLYVGIDLHSTNSYIVIIDETGTPIYQKRQSNDLPLILSELNGFSNIVSIVVESTYNWYWLVDGLLDAGFSVKLANPSAIQQYSGIKHTNDKTDARWLAELDRLNILPTGYIYPKEKRSLRDLLRKRLQLVQQSTTNLLSIQTLIERNTSIRLAGNKIKQLTSESLKTYLNSNNVLLAAESNLIILHCLQKRIRVIEKHILTDLKNNPIFKNLMEIDGIGKIISSTILLETGDINRFKTAGHYASYCRCVNSNRESNNKKKGENNRKNGNHYLTWAYVEAAHFAIRHDEAIKRYYHRKASKTKSVIAIKTVAHKLARAFFYVMRDGVAFDVKLAFIS